ncbi:cilia- and flagella-associated protein 36 [Orussus abietinus]|uniref:cilia- and flagella-associated protein 36 n=1 Tax=Orussus abietinus TaxID=222816 RepID=UPI000625E546|nr:cilia- and flagella-associated protein 36 [Orussus abietinus]
MTTKEDSAWVFDSLVGFLQGPIWSAPLLTFIEEKSLIFEAGTMDGPEYREVYQDYKNLVDLLLRCYMEDMGITPEQFEHACSVNKNTKMPVPFNQSLFEQIWAANEYEIFKRMMIQKNLELQLQALNLIEQTYGLTPASLTYEPNSTQDDELVMEELLRERALEDHVETSSDLEVETVFLKEHERLTNEYRNEKALLEQAIRISTETPKNIPPVLEHETQTTSSETDSVPNVTIPEMTPEPLDSTAGKKKINNTANEEEIRKRQVYLKARRDKLVALKKQARSQRLGETTGDRPSSARVVAEATVNGKQDLEVPQSMEPSTLQVRKALAARLKAEVVRK